MNPTEYFHAIKLEFQQKGDPSTALQQMAYMKNQFEFFGLKMPAWMVLTKNFHLQNGLPDGDDLKTLARLCFADDHRELHYFAIETVQKQLKKQPEGFIFFLEELILEKSWWDSVDWLAKLVALHFKKFPALIRPTAERWIDSEELWLQRVALTFQRFFHAKTEADLLFACIEKVIGSREFFLQKGAGWALREFSKFDSEAVTAFVEAHPNLAPLTKREALRLLKKG